MSGIANQASDCSATNGSLVEKPGCGLRLSGYGDAVEIGRGGFGVVYRATQKSLDRLVAIKLLSAAALDEPSLKRFDAECHAMAALAEHPNIVSIHDHGVSENDGRPYIVMEYVSGGTLAEQGALPWQCALEIGVKLCGALETAHRAGIIHRDVKPENVLVSKFAQVKLADFGIAKIRTSTNTPTSSGITASFLHAAPEILAGHRPDSATDVYSLGSTIYALILGHAPFERAEEESLTPLITRIFVDEPPSLAERGVPGELSAVLERALAKEPGDRYASAADFGASLRNAQRKLGLALTDMPVAGDLPVTGPAIASRYTDPRDYHGVRAPEKAKPARSTRRSPKKWIAVTVVALALAGGMMEAGQALASQGSPKAAITAPTVSRSAAPKAAAPTDHPVSKPKAPTPAKKRLVSVAHKPVAQATPTPSQAPTAPCCQADPAPLPTQPTLPAKPIQPKTPTQPKTSTPPTPPTPPGTNVTPPPLTPKTPPIIGSPVLPGTPGTPPPLTGSVPTFTPPPPPSLP